MAKVFYVDDDKMLLNVFGKGFKLSGHEITLHQTTENIIEKIKEENPQPDLILLDMKLPGKDGFEILKLIKSEESINNIPVICFSNLATEEDQKKAVFRCY